MPAHQRRPSPARTDTSTSAERASVAPHLKGPEKNLRSDVVLYHEMVHANHAVYNTWDYDPVTKKGGGKKGDVSGGVAESEYQATGLGEHAQDRYSENRYRQERRAIGESNHGEIRGDDKMAYRNKYLDFAD